MKQFFTGAIAGMFVTLGFVILFSMQDRTEVIFDTKQPVEVTDALWVIENAEVDSIELRLVDYFDAAELKVIIEAAKANDCFNDDLFPILLAIRKAENGGPGKEFGVIHPRAWGTDLRTQAGWAARTIANNKIRWLNDDEGKPFLTFLRDRYAPLNASNDPTGLNHNWLGNVREFTARFDNALLHYRY